MYVNKYLMEVEQLMVVVTYEYIRGEEGDYWHPPIPDSIKIKSWELLNGEKFTRAQYPDYDDEEWSQWMADIDTYVWNNAEEDIWNCYDFWDN